MPIFIEAPVHVVVPNFRVLFTAGILNFGEIANVRVFFVIMSGFGAWGFLPTEAVSPEERTARASEGEVPVI